MGNKDTVVGFAIGFSLGAVIGLTAGFLFAPRAGENTRKLFKEKATSVPERAREITADRKKVYTETWRQRQEQTRASP